jgi:hypothetical protein
VGGFLGGSEEVFIAVRNFMELFSGVGGWSLGDWSPESRVSPVADGVPRWVDRIRCSGNALLPQIAELIWDAVGELDDSMIIPGR